MVHSVIIGLVSFVSVVALWLSIGTIKQVNKLTEDCMYNDRELKKRIEKLQHPVGWQKSETPEPRP